MILDPVTIGFGAATLAVPALHFADPEARGDRSARVIAGLMPLLAFAACLPFARGRIGALLAGLYIGLAVVLGLRALPRALSRPALQASEVGLAAAWIWAVGGGVWLLVSASGGTLRGFGGTWALLTAAHFHAAGFAAIAVTALLVRALGRGAWLLALHPIAFALVAAGIDGAPALEKAGTVAYIALFAAQWGVAVRGGVARRRGGRLVLLALTVPLITLALAADWALGARRLDLMQMAWLHGLANAVGHGLLGLWGFGRMAPRPRTGPIEAPFSNCRAPGRVGPAFVDRIRPAHPVPRTGLTDDLSRYARPDFDPAAVDPALVRFYTHTADFHIEATHEWQRGFRLGGALWGLFARLIGQMGLPGPRVPAGAMSNAILDIDDAVDGRPDVRAWVRTWKATGATLYVALYSEHVTAGARYMNIAFPVPGGNMTSLLRIEQRPAGALALTTRRASGDRGDQGVYLRLGRARPWRLPIDETITVERDGARLVARHDMWLFGRLFLVLRYVMRPVEGVV